MLFQGIISSLASKCSPILVEEYFQFRDKKLPHSTSYAIAWGWGVPTTLFSREVMRVEEAGPSGRKWGDWGRAFEGANGRRPFQPLPASSRGEQLCAIHAAAATAARRRAACCPERSQMASKVWVIRSHSSRWGIFKVPGSWYCFTQQNPSWQFPGKAPYFFLFLSFFLFFFNH
jgi:hypothetical protein